MQSVSNDQEETLSLTGHRNPVLKYVACHFTDQAELGIVINCFYTFSRITQDRGSWRFILSTVSLSQQTLHYGDIRHSVRPHFFHNTACEYF